MVLGKTDDSDSYDRMVSQALRVIELTFQQFFEIRKIVLLHYNLPFVI